MFRLIDELEYDVEDTASAMDRVSRKTDEMIRKAGFYTRHFFKNIFLISIFLILQVVKVIFAV